MFRVFATQSGGMNRRLKCEVIFGVYAYLHEPLGPVFRKGEKKGAGYTLYAFGPDPSAMSFDNGLGDGQPKAGSFNLAVTPGRNG